MTKTDVVPTDVIAGALRNLAQLMDSDDGLFGAALYQAAARLEEQAEEIEQLRNERDALLAELTAIKGQELSADSVKAELLYALIHLEHNARKSGAEMGLALDVARTAIAAARKEDVE